MNGLEQMFEQYGYWLLFLGLLAESVALPFPGELAMAYASHLADGGHLALWAVYAVVFAGATVGTTITYALGRKLGLPFFERYGKFIFLSPARIANMQTWFAKYGTKLLLVSYFIPGLRHFTGYLSGMLHIRLRTFLLFNHTGALLWVLVYCTIGYLLGDNWERGIHLVSKYSLRAGICAAVVLIVYLAVKKMRSARSHHPGG